MIAGILGNITVITYNIFSNREKTVTCYLLANLALADLLVCLTFYPIWIIEFVQTLLNIDSDQELFCKLSRSSMLALFFVSVATILILTIDRYLFIVKPLKYPLIVTVKRVKNIVAAIWVISCGFLCLMAAFFESSKLKRSYCRVPDEIYWPYEIIILYIPITFVFILNLNILRIAQRQRRRILVQTRVIGHTRPLSRMLTFRQTNALKSVKTFLIVISILAFCCLIPAVTGISLYFFVCKNCHTTTTWYVVFNFELYGINSIANPFVYGVRHPRYRQSLKYFFKNLCCR